MMANYKSLSIVPVDDIPKTVVDCPTTDLVDLYKLCSYMEELCEKEKGIGLSAVQVGIPWKLFIVRYNSGSVFFHHYVNCEYIPLSEEKEKSLEGCLSLKKADGQLRYFEVERYTKIKVKGQMLKSDPKLELIDFDKIVDPKNYYRVVYQHEIDHSGNGIFSPTLISDIGKEIKIWKN